MLEQRFRFDLSEQHAGNGANTTVLDGGRGLDLIVSPGNEALWWTDRRSAVLSARRKEGDRMHYLPWFATDL
jgi:hypothetical protein